ncbi:MAG: hypothetical protein U1E34_05570 [Amaricoccus sp.]
MGRLARSLTSLAALALLAGCGSVTPMTGQATPAETCRVLFEQFDYYSQLAPAPRADEAANVVLPGNLGRLAQQVISNGCLTSSSDIAGMEQLSAKLGFRKPQDSGAAIKPVALQVGVLTSITDVTRATVFFNNLGYRTRTIGAAGLGRRLYIGPFTSQGAMDQAADYARQAGFIAPYPSQIFRFW